MLSVSAFRGLGVKGLGFRVWRDGPGKNGNFRPLCSDLRTKDACIITYKASVQETFLGQGGGSKTPKRPEQEDPQTTTLNPKP